MKKLKKALKYSKSKNKKISWQPAPDIKLRILKLTHELNLNWIKPTQIKCLRSVNAKTLATARIWGLSKIWQMSLDEKPIYIIEVISEKYDILTEVQKDKILLHELAHIPKNFSGALLLHRRKGKGSFYVKLNELLIRHQKKYE